MHMCRCAWHVHFVGGRVEIENLRPKYLEQLGGKSKNETVIRHLGALMPSWQLWKKRNLVEKCFLLKCLLLTVKKSPLYACLAGTLHACKGERRDRHWDATWFYELGVGLKPGDVGFIPVLILNDLGQIIAHFWACGSPPALVCLVH